MQFTAITGRTVTAAEAFAPEPDREVFITRGDGTALRPGDPGFNEAMTSFEHMRAAAHRERDAARARERARAHRFAAMERERTHHGAYLVRPCTACAAGLDHPAEVTR